jgi:hypothetical protein
MEGRRLILVRETDFEADPAIIRKTTAGGPQLTGIQPHPKAAHCLSIREAHRLRNEYDMSHVDRPDTVISA